MYKVNLNMLVQYQTLNMRTNSSHQLPYLTLSKFPYLMYSREETIHYQLLNQTVMQLSAKLFVLKTKLKRNCLI